VSKFADDVDLDNEFPVGREEDPGRRPDDDWEDPDPPVDYPEEPRRPRKGDVAVRPRRRGPDMGRAPRPRDREPAARRADATPVMDEAQGILVIRVEHDGMDLTIPADPEDWPIQATLAFEQGKVITAIRGILSAEDFAKIIEKKYRNKDFGKLYEALARAGGFETAGN